MIITLSNRQIKAADRFGGALMLIPWPAGLAPGARLAPHTERSATAGEHAAAVAMLATACSKNKLVHVDTRVMTKGDGEQRLAALVVGERWPVETRRPVKPVACWISPENAKE